MASSCEEEYSALYLGIVDDEDNYVKFKIDRKDLGDFRKLDFSVTFDEAQRQLWVRTRKDNVLYQCNYLIKGLIKTSNLEGGLKKKKDYASLRIEKDLKNGKFNLNDK
ncbi:uncharacterized protein LOC110465329 [Mizuhopecten yessoensis]|uniref:uncharacterized protein LOC110465329 n=1 Tax=Mizuhopecten yessoensis TaxID=6573 RepID=UPI000B458149|nr:uncharacterized protein LOC110465329 [Mizuhopecten yessoensis]XP_021376742.1 uncharacterized protein LOC110465329 [Mizuhopecten yessoensis]XP_021376743.1 uncharacterized protein LOC110465329 [Mizuhopecten yessoensis]XP_021376744.1 uncharacterized protein LOC110465329 [Mizuhopecten yessoensis]XP_021376745.1 uncharacterized protein LOC110465329 [Mizuhopecten yessoensis]XP_021376746.1 uncharacterized protein LOC110465329 [Mizuhopecten yessoensis]XP_021376747.1 uncharacterized protein LOC11046